MLPGMTGDEVLATIRATSSSREIPVLMLTARREEPDRIRGLALGADDYLTKPFSPQELVLRVGAILRRLAAPPAAPTERAAATAGDVLQTGPLVIDRAAMTVEVDGRRVEL